VRERGNQPASPDTGFVTQQANDRLASRLIGLNIQHSASETIGQIHDIALTDANAVRAIIVRSVSFLGYTRYVAIDPKADTLKPTG
jgi:PRC-barrel domain